jgi:hypothetical protein
MSRFTTPPSANPNLLLARLVRVHAGKVISIGLFFVLLLVSRFSPLGEFLAGAEDAWTRATTRALPVAKPARQPSDRAAQMGVRELWGQIRGLIDLAVHVHETAPVSLPNEATLERYRTVETMSDLFPVTGTPEKIRQRIVSGEVNEKGLLDLMAPELKGGWRPASPAPQR